MYRIHFVFSDILSVKNVEIIYYELNLNFIVDFLFNLVYSCVLLTKHKSHSHNHTMPAACVMVISFSLAHVNPAAIASLVTLYKIIGSVFIISNFQFVFLVTISKIEYFVRIFNWSLKMFIYRKNNSNKLWKDIIRAITSIV